MKKLLEETLPLGKKWLIKIFVLVTLWKLEIGFQMKRYNNLFDKIVSLDNLYEADKRARR